MANAAEQHWDLNTFLTWESEQPDRYEFVGGIAQMMAGGTMAHSLISTNILSALRPSLRGSSCRPNGSDLRVPIPNRGNSRYPDITVDCGQYVPTSHDAAKPTVIFEILSESTKWYDLNQKVEDYGSLPTVQQYICISQSEVRLNVWKREHDGRFVKQPDITDPHASVDLESLTASLPLEAIYEGTDLISVPVTGAGLGR